MSKKLTKKFIKQQKERLEAELEKVTRQIKELKKNDPFTDPDHVTDNAAIDTDVREQVGHETIEAQIKDLEKRSLTTTQALKKIIKNDYGVCDRCHKEIPLPRLKLIAEAQYCIECERKLRR